VLKRIDGKICQPLELILEPRQHFDRADQAVDDLARRIEMDKEKTPSTALANSVNQTELLIRRLEEILNEMQRLIEFNQALAILRDIIGGQGVINEILQKLHKDRLKGEIDSEFDTVPKKKP
jgi:hypothetical protein